MSMHINEDRESHLLLVGLEERVMRQILTYVSINSWP
jgi:hypothetical protein